MGQTRFTGPVVSGPILDTSGSTLGNNIANAGLCVLTQQQAGVTQASGATTIVIPAGSQILSIYAMVTTAWSGVAKTFGIGTTASATALTAAAALDGTNLGPLSATPGTDATRIGNWDNVGTSDIQIQVTSTNTGTGVATITVVYVQGANNAS